MNLRGAGDERESMTIKSYESLPSLENEISLPSFYRWRNSMVPANHRFSTANISINFPAIDIEGDVFTREKYIDSKLW